MRNSVLRYLRNHPGILLLGIIGITVTALLLTLIPADYLSQNRIWSFDKLGHLAIFGAWTFLLGLYKEIRTPHKTNLPKIFVLGILFGGLIEILQYLLPVNRQADIYDFAVDTLGALIAVILLKILFSGSDRQGSEA